MTNDKFKDQKIVFSDVHVLYQNISTPYTNPSNMEQYTMTVLIDNSDPKLKELKGVIDRETERAFGKNAKSVIQDMMKKTRNSGEPTYILIPTVFKELVDGELVEKNVMDPFTTEPGYYKPWDQYHRLILKSKKRPEVRTSDGSLVDPKDEQTIRSLLSQGSLVGFSAHIWAGKNKKGHTYLWCCPELVMRRGKGHQLLSSGSTANLDSVAQMLAVPGSQNEEV